MKNLVTNTDMKLLAKNVTSENIEKFFLNNINKLLYKVARFMRSLIRTAINIVAGSSDVDFAPSDKIGDNPPTNPAVQSKDDISNDKNTSRFSSNNSDSQPDNNTYADNKDDSDNQSVTSLLVFIKNHSCQHQNKGVIAIACFLMTYERNKNANFLQMVAKYFVFGQNVPKHCIEIFHKMGLLVTSEIICQALQANNNAVLQQFCEKVCKEHFLISYNNMNFYGKVQNKRVHNKAYQVAYIVGYVCIMKGDGYFRVNIVNYNTIIYLKSADFLLDLAECNYCQASLHYMLS